MSSLKDLKCLTNSRLTVEDLNIEVEYLIENFLVKKTLNMLYAKGGMGKSFLALSLAIHLLNEKLISECIYMDMDNSAVALKSRNLDKIIEENKNLIYIHASKVDSTPLSFLKELLNESNKDSSAFENSLIILDSIKDFVGNKDITTDKDTHPIMETLKQLRDNGMTIIFLHHTTKDMKVIQHKGATTFRDTSDSSYEVISEKKGDNLLYELKIDKIRMLTTDVAFTLDTKTLKLESKNIETLNLPEHEYNFIVQVQLLLFDTYEDLNQSELIKELNSELTDKTVRKYLKKYENRYWKVTKDLKANNASYYSIVNPLPNLPKLLDPKD